MLVPLPSPYPHALAVASRNGRLHLLRSPDEYCEEVPLRLNDWISLSCLYGAPHPDLLDTAIEEEVTSFFDGVLRSDWGWGSIVESARESIESDEEGGLIGREYLGSVLCLSPSGKFYTPWACSNVTRAEAFMDECWYAVLEAIAEEHDGYIASGEGDPCDLFFEIAIAAPEEGA